MYRRRDWFDLPSELNSLHETLQFGGWGFPIGDQGGGASGFRAVQQTLTEFMTVGASLTRDLVMKKTGSKLAILEWIIEADATDYAQFARALVDIESQCSTAKAIIEQGTTQIEQLTQACSSNNTLPIMFLGSLGQFYRERLSLAIQDRSLHVQR